MLAKRLNQLEVGDRIYSLDFEGDAIVTKTTLLLFDVKIVSGPNAGEKAQYPYTADATAFDKSQKDMNAIEGLQLVHRVGVRRAERG